VWVATFAVISPLFESFRCATKKISENSAQFEYMLRFRVSLSNCSSTRGKLIENRKEKKKLMTYLVFMEQDTLMGYENPPLEFLLFKELNFSQISSFSNP